MKLEKYAHLVADYISDEYDGLGEEGVMTDDERYAVKSMLQAHYESKDSVNNAANYIMNYIKLNRLWMKENCE
jgi:predicted Zn-dependent peptidase